MILLMGLSMAAGSGQMKLYGMKSGKVTYRLHGSGNVMGVDINSSGTKVLTFDNYGAKSLTDQTKEVAKTVKGKATVEIQHVVTYSDGEALYMVDFAQKRIIKMQNPTASIFNAKGEGKKVGRKSISEIMIQTGAIKVGTETILGYSCDIWKIMENKQYLYQGVVLKVDTHIMGMKGVMEARKAVFGIALSNDSFALPNYPLYDVLGKQIKNTK